MWGRFRQAAWLWRCASPPTIGCLANSTFYILLDIGVGVGPLLLGIVQPLWGYRGLFEAMSLVAIVALAAYLLVSRKKGAMRRELEEAEKR